MAPQNRYSAANWQEDEYPGHDDIAPAPYDAVDAGADPFADLPIPDHVIDMDAFSPSSTWVVPRVGYVFKRDSRGMGYYKDEDECMRHFGDVDLLND